jgi:hypothetical protein
MIAFKHILKHELFHRLSPTQFFNVIFSCVQQIEAPSLHLLAHIHHVHTPH